ncbi:MAG: hypothetical protein K1X53_00910, partial [Candidatus Sumerlaeaceae bacterium]|nr:hypothetical protein [Candidatus Sumerlaeaceae bacterium]
GTLSGNPISMSAGRAAVAEIFRRGPDLFQGLETLGAKLQEGLLRALNESGVNGCVQRVGSMLTLFFHPGPVTNMRVAGTVDTRKFARFFHAMLHQGVYLPPSQFECWFISTAHTEIEIQRTVDAARMALQAVASN